MEELKDETGLVNAINSREGNPLFLFKHSTTCPISAAAYQRVTEYLKAEGDEAVPVYLVKVIESRPLSTLIGERLNVKHESPQVILVKGGAALWSASHGNISAAAMRRAVEVSDS